MRLSLSFTSGFFTLYILLLIPALFKFDITYIKYAVPMLNLIAGFYLQKKTNKATVTIKGENDILTKINLSGLQRVIVIALLVFVVVTIYLREFNVT